MKSSPKFLRKQYVQREVSKLLVIVAAILFIAMNGCISFYKGSPIFGAVMRGDLETTRSMLDKNPSLVSLRNNIGETVLFLAVTNINGNQNKIEIAKLLIAKGADVNARDNRGASPLTGAVANNKDPDKEILDVLASHGAMIDKTLLFGVTRPGIAEWLIQKGADVNAIKDDQTPLLRLSQWGGDNVVATATLLISKGAGIQVRDKNGATPLHIASLNGRHDTVSLLLAKGAEVNATDNLGKRPLTYALVGHDAIAKFIATKGQAPTFYQFDSVTKPGQILSFFAPNVAIDANTFLKGYIDTEALLRQHGGHE